MAAPRDQGPSATSPPDNPIAPARPASTVVLARDGADGLEIYLVQRHGSMGFMGGMHVFPGGKVAASDASPHMRARLECGVEGSRHEQWGDEIDRDAALHRLVAAVRETFEEAGVLVVDAPSSRDFAELRARLLAGEDFGRLLEQAGLKLQPALLEPLSRWITPESEPTRFDTTFYVARAPSGQEAAHDTQESVAGVWLAPSRALESSAAQKIRLAPPTARTLETLADASSVDAALALARSRPPPSILPIIRSVGSDVMIYYPGDPEHPVKTPFLKPPTRLVLRKRG
jgi:8-oxo-dGTP pyrophosphatase MutT (NUDIX family)